MIRRVRPDAEEGARLVAIDEAAYGRDCPWNAEEFAEIGARENAAIFADPALAEGMVVLQGAGGQAEILTIAVIPDSRRRGLARALMMAAHDFAMTTGATEVFLEVADDNLPALRLYADMGYCQTGLRRRYYLRPDGSRTDALVMRVEL